MNKLLNSSFLTMLQTLLALLVIAKIISFIASVLLPEKGVELIANKSLTPNYHRVDFKNMIENPQQKKRVVPKVSQGMNLTNMVLKGLFGKGREGFIIIALKVSSNKTSIISVGENYSGYRLKSILSDGAVFEKNVQEYILRIDSKKIDTKTAYIEEVKEESNTVKVQRSNITHYQKNPEAIWKDIGINEIKNGNTIDGFRVTYVRKGSKMDMLGLKKGDIIIKANNKELHSYKDAFDIYNQINTLNTISIVIKRDNNEKELVYEID